MRLDQYLVNSKLVSTRSKAKRAISNSLVTIDNTLASKPAQNIKSQIITVTNKRLAEMPEGYFKLEQIQALTNIIRRGDIVLDLGSSAGGYLLFASEIAKVVYGIEFSREFEKELAGIKKRNIHILFGDAFTIEPAEITNNKTVDLILNDLTLEWENSLTALSRFIPLLKRSGRVLMTIKASKPDEREIRVAFRETNLNVIKIFKLENIKKEFYVIAEKQHTTSTR